MNDSSLFELLRYEPLLARIVRDIVRHDDVPDVLQKTWLAAIKGPQPKPESVGPWLTRVARNFAYEHLRSEANRRTREQNASAPTPPPAVEAALQKMAARERVARAVRALEEPYRSAIVLRYLEERPYPEIAAELGASEAAVRKQVERGLGQLRACLVEEDDLPPRALSLSALFAAFCQRARVRASPGGVFLAAAASVAAVSLIVVGALEVAGGANGDGGRGAARLAAGLAHPGEPGGLAVRASRSAGRESAEVPVAASVPDGSLDAARLALVRGRVLDPDGNPLEGVQVLRHGGRSAATSDLRGAFALEGLPARGFDVADPYVAVYSSGAPGSPWLQELDEHLLVVAPGVSIEGVVRDAAGRTLPDVEVSARLVLPVRFPAPLASTIPWKPRFTRSDAEGRFSLAELPAGCTEVEFRHPGREPMRVPVASAEDFLEVVLHRPLGDTLVSGTVVDEAGWPVRDATVAIASRTAISRSDGTYELALDLRARRERSVTVSVARAGYATEVRTVLAAELARGEAVDWTLAHAQAIAGRVLGPDGRPWAGAFVVPWGEELVRGTLGRTDLAQPCDAPVFFFDLANRAVAVTDESGWFRLAGFAPGEHVLGVVDPALTLVHVSDELCAGGPDVVIRTPADTHRAIRGRVTDAAGRPAAGVSVLLSLQVLNNGGTDTWRSTERAVRTAPDGSFHFDGVPIACRALVSFFDPPSFFEPRVVEPGPEARCDVTLEPLQYFRLDLSKYGEGATHAWVQDAEGRPLPIIESHQSARFEVRHTVSLIGGRSAVLATPRRATSVGLVGDPSFEIPFRVRAGEVTTIGG